MLKDDLKKWLSEKSSIRGLLGCGIYFPDQSILGNSVSNEFSAKALENAWRCLSETIQSFRSQEIQSHHVQWMFEKAILHGSMRSDGVCLGIFTKVNQEDFDLVSIQNVIQEFQNLK